MTWNCNKCGQSGEKFDGCAISECEMVYTTRDEPAAIAELRRRVTKANELAGNYDNRGNHALGAFLTAVLQEYETVLKELEDTQHKTEAFRFNLMELADGMARGGSKMGIEHRYEILRLLDER